MIRYPDLIFADNLPTFSTHTFELGIIAAGNNETEIDIDREIEKRSLNLAAATTTTQAPKVDFKLPNRRPKSLAISTTSPLMSELELNGNNSNNFFAISNERNDYSKFIEVGGGPSALPAKYHTEVKLRRAKSSTLAGSCVDQRHLDNNNRLV